MFNVMLIWECPRISITIRAATPSDRHVTRFEGEPCEDHGYFTAACFKCHAPDEAAEIKQAEWHWQVDLTIMDTDDDGDEVELFHGAKHFMTTEVDPRAVEFSNFGPLR